MHLIIKCIRYRGYRKYSILLSFCNQTIIIIYLLIIKAIVDTRLRRRSNVGNVFECCFVFIYFAAVPENGKLFEIKLNEMKTCAGLIKRNELRKIKWTLAESAVEPLRSLCRGQCNFDLV